MSVALVFPGQGSQRPGMFAEFAGDAVATRTFGEAADVLGYDPRDHDDVESLRSTVHVQVGLFVCGVVSMRMLESRDARPTVVAGHSVGAFAAAVACGSVTFTDALAAVAVRARTMEQLCPRGYGMAVSSGVAENAVRAVVAQLFDSGARVYVANVNAPAQIVISGEVRALEEALAQCRRLGARRAELLAVAVPSHCELMLDAADAVRDRLRDIAIAPPRIGYASAMRAAIVRSAQGVRDDLCDGVAREVRWEQTARLIVELGTCCAIEAMPGHVLTDLWPQETAMRVAAMDGARLDSSAALLRRYRSPPTE